MAQILLKTVVKEIMDTHGWNRERAAKKLNVSRQGLESWLNGTSTRIGTRKSAIMFAHYTDKPIGHLFTGETTKAAWEARREAIEKNPKLRPPAPAPIKRTSRRASSGSASRQDPELNAIAETASSTDELATSFIEHFLSKGAITEDEKILLNKYADANGLTMAAVLFQASAPGVDLKAFVGDIANDTEKQGTIIEADQKRVEREDRELFERVAQQTVNLQPALDLEPSVVSIDTVRIDLT